MTDEAAEILTIVYHLGDVIRAKDWPTALVVWERLLMLHAPLASTQPHLATVLQNEVAMINLAERQSTQIH